MSSSVLLTFWCPLIGSLLAWSLAFSPVPQMLRDRRIGTLTKDALPHPINFTTNFAWCVYSVAVVDAWPFICNVPGMLAGCFCMISAYALAADVKLKLMLEQLILAGMAVIALMVMLTLSSAVISSPTHRAEVAGLFCLVLCAIQFIVPALGTVRACRSGNGANLSLPLSVTGFFTTCFWATYGLATDQPAMWISNWAGALLSASVCATRLLLGMRRRERHEEAPLNAHAALLAARDDGRDVLVRASAGRRHLQVPRITTDYH